MQRVKRSTAVALLPAAPAGGTPGFFAAPDPGGGIPATVPGYEWFNDVQEELMAVIEGQGLAASGVDRTQLRQAITKMIQAGQRAVVVDNATFAPAVNTNGQIVYWDSANNRFDLAIADGTVKQQAVGAADVANAKVYCFGAATLFAGLTPGSRYYLSSTVAGGMVLVAPGIGRTVLVAIARTTTEAFVDIDQDAAVNALARLQRFTASGNFVPPVAQVFVTLVGGGASSAGSGNSSSFGAYLTATGGSGSAGGTPNGDAGMGGVNGGYYGTSKGGSTPFGQGGFYGLNSGSTAPTGYGSAPQNGAGAGYGSGGWYLDEPVAVTPGETIAVTIAAAVSGAKPGLCIVRW